MLHAITLHETSLTTHTDSSHYPDKHTYFGYSQDAGVLESDVARVIDKLSMKTGYPLREVVELFVEDISRGNCECDDGNENEDDESDVMMSDEDFEQSGYLGYSQTPQLSLGHLMKYAFLKSANFLAHDGLQGLCRGQS